MVAIKSHILFSLTSAYLTVTQDQQQELAGQGVTQAITAVLARVTVVPIDCETGSTQKDYFFFS